MKAADLRDRHDATIVGHGDRTRDRRVLVQRQVRARVFIVGAIEKHEPPQAGRAEHDDVIKTLATYGSDEPFHAFCQGEPGAVRTSSIPIAFAVFAHASNA